VTQAFAPFEKMRKPDAEAITDLTIIAAFLIGVLLWVL